MSFVFSHSPDIISGLPRAGVDVFGAVSVRPQASRTAGPVETLVGNQVSFSVYF